MAVGTDLILDPADLEASFAPGRNFANKIWNAGRFLLLNRDQLGLDPGAPQRDAAGGEFALDHCDLADRWILSRYHSASLELESGMKGFEMNKISKAMYDFFWHDYCDWYLEMIKSRLYGEEPAAVKKAVVSRALGVYDAALRLLHPLMPFITEELWQTICTREDAATIMRSRIPDPDPAMIDRDVERQMTFVQNVIEAVRNIRGEMSIPPSREITLAMKTGAAHPPASLRLYEGYLQRLARVTSLSFLEGTARPRMAAAAVVDGEELFVPLEGLIDIGLERARLQKEIDRIAAMLSGIRAKLANESFTAKAPPDVVAREREKESAFETTMTKLMRSLEQLSDGA
jgi:valyl-tRNA synthetase